MKLCGSNKAAQKIVGLRQRPTLHVKSQQAANFRGGPKQVHNHRMSKLLNITSDLTTSTDLTGAWWRSRTTRSPAAES